jgi:hypothetical protein
MLRFEMGLKLPIEVSVAKVVGCFIKSGSSWKHWYMPVLEFSSCAEILLNYFLNIPRSRSNIPFYRNIGLNIKAF